MALLENLKRTVSETSSSNRDGRLMIGDIEVRELLIQNPELQAGASAACAILKQEFADCDVFPSVTEDPETGEKQLVMEVRSPAYSAEERARLRYVVRELLPEPTLRVRSRMVFDMVRA